jgi:hypothetical protein
MLVTCSAGSLKFYLFTYISVTVNVITTQNYRLEENFLGLSAIAL